MDSDNKASEHQTKLIKEDEKARNNKVMPKNTINKLKDVMNYLKDLNESNLNFQR